MSRQEFSDAARRRARETAPAADGQKPEKKRLKHARVRKLSLKVPVTARRALLGASLLVGSFTLTNMLIPDNPENAAVEYYPNGVAKLNGAQRRAAFVKLNPGVVEDTFKKTRQVLLEHRDLFETEMSEAYAQISIGKGWRYRHAQEAYQAIIADAAPQMDLKKKAEAVQEIYFTILDLTTYNRNETNPVVRAFEARLDALARNELGFTREFYSSILGYSGPPADKIGVGTAVKGDRLVITPPK